MKRWETLGPLWQENQQWKDIWRQVGKHVSDWGPAGFCSILTQNLNKHVTNKFNFVIMKNISMVIKTDGILTTSTRMLPCYNEIYTWPQ